MNERISMFLGEVCSEIKNKEVHSEVSEEIRDHILEAIEDYIDRGIEEDLAIEKALTRVGNPRNIGSDLNKIHRGKLDWINLTITAVLIVIGMVALISLHKHNLLSSYRSIVINIFAILLGVGIALVIYFYDYRRMEKYSKCIYIGSVGIILITWLIPSYINGGYFLYGITIGLVSLLGVVIGLSGILKNIRLQGISDYLKLSFLLFFPITLYVFIANLTIAGIYFITILILMKKANLNFKYISIFITTILIVFSIPFATRPYMMDRINSFRDPYKNPEGVGYLFIQADKVLNEAAIVGQASERGNELIKGLPVLENDMILVYIIYKFGWLIGFSLIVTMIIYILRMTSNIKKVKSLYGEILATGITSIFFLQILIGILFTFGMAPTGYGIPFIGAGGTNQVVSIIMIGILSSIYKRKSLGVVEV